MLYSSFYWEAHSIFWIQENACGREASRHNSVPREAIGHLPPCPSLERFINKGGSPEGCEAFKNFFIREGKDQCCEERSLTLWKSSNLRGKALMKECPSVWAGFYASAALQHGCGKQALGEDVKAGRVLKSPTVLSVAAQEEMEVLWWKVYVVKLQDAVGKEGRKKDFTSRSLNRHVIRVYFKKDKINSAETYWLKLRQMFTSLTLHLADLNICVGCRSVASPCSSKYWFPHPLRSVTVGFNKTAADHPSPVGLSLSCLAVLHGQEHRKVKNSWVKINF